MIILGFNCYGHDSAAVLLVDDRVLFAVEEERLNRKKHYGGFPENAIRQCLQFGGVTLADVDHVTFSWNPWISYSHIPLFLFRYLHRVPSLLREQKHFTVEENLGMLNYLGDMRRLPKTLRRTFPGTGRADFRFHLLEHHLCHAASTFYASGHDDAAILTVDGAGEWTTALMAHGRGNEIRKLRSVETPHSVGAFYQAIGRHLGFKLITGPGKLMGLASYGNRQSAVYDDMKQLIKFRRDGRFSLDMRYFSYHYTRKSGVSPRFQERFGPSKPDAKDWSQHELDVAAATQRLAEEIIRHMAEQLKRITGSRHLCMAGGVALNSVANGLLTKSGLFDDVFIQPATGDSGTALGSTLLLNHAVMDRKRAYVMETAFLGPGGEDEDYRAELEKAGIPFVRTRRYPEFAARMLTAGKILGWHQGRMEFGPRALGNRSILADPTRAGMKDVVNARVKFRAGLRPFAVIVLEEECGTYFDCSVPSPYMLKVYQVRPEYRDKLPAITHVDQSARIQTVNRTENPEMRRLLEAFQAEKGISALLNTSFNVKGEPIVCTAADSVATFIKTDLDYLVIGNYLVAKPGDGAVLQEWAE